MLMRELALGVDLLNLVGLLTSIFQRFGLRPIFSRTRAALGSLGQLRSNFLLYFIEYFKERFRKNLNNFKDMKLIGGCQKQQLPFDFVFGN